MHRHADTLWMVVMALIFTAVVLILATVFAPSGETSEKKTDADNAVYETCSDYGWVDSTDAVR